MKASSKQGKRNQARAGIAVVVAMATLFVYTAAYANPATVAGFAIDAQIQRQGALDDWATNGSLLGVLDGVTRSGGCSPANSNPVLLCDDVKSDGTTFPGGAKESDPPGWVPIQSGQLTPKTDITNVYAYGKLDSSNDPVIINGMERLPKAGDVHLDFEYNKATTGTGVNTIPDRKVGDVLVAYDLGGSRQSNDNAIEIRVYVAKPVVASCSTSTCAGAYDYANANFTAIGSGEIDDAVHGIFAKQNTDTIDSGPWQSYDEHYALQDTLPAFSFFEAGIDLTKAVGIASACFNFVTVKSRASESVTSQLKDTTGIVPFPFCGGLVVQKYIDKNANGSYDSATDVANPTSDLSGWSFTVKNSGNTVVCEGTTDSTGNLTCSTSGSLTGLAPGSYTVTETSPYGKTLGSNDAAAYNTDPGPLPDSTHAPKTAAVSKTGTVTVGSDGSATPVRFGNTCFVRENFEVSGVPSGTNGFFIFYTITGGQGSVGATRQDLTSSLKSGTTDTQAASTGFVLTKGNSISWGFGINHNNVGGTEQTHSSGTVNLNATAGYYPSCTNTDTDQFGTRTIKGFKFKDVNSDGVRQPLGTDGAAGGNDDEVGLPGFVFQLLSGSNVIDTATSCGGAVTCASGDPTGTYVFSSVAPGSYTIHERKASESGAAAKSPVGWKQTLPTSNGDLTGVAVGLNDTTVTVGDFANTPLSDLSLTFTPQTTPAATHATVVCKDGSTTTLTAKSGDPANTYTFQNLEIKQSVITCTITVTDP